MKHKLRYLDLTDIQGGWGQLFNELPNWITEIRKLKYEPLDKATELEYILAGKRDEVIERNLRFVTNIARHYLTEEIPIWELISAGNEGLMKAYDKFDASRNTKLITYAVNHVRSNMISVMREHQIIKLSAKAIQLLADFSDYGDIDTMKAALPHRYPQTNKSLNKKIDEYLLMKWVSSIDDTYEDGSSKSENISASSNKRYTDEVNLLLEESNLTTEELFIVKSMFGLDGEEPKGSRGIGKVLGKSKDAVRRIKLDAFAKLREMDALKNILDFIKEEDSEAVLGKPILYRSNDE